VNNYDLVFEDPIQRCEMCGIIDSTRPYGLKHEEICYECAAEDPALTAIRSKEFYLGEL
jgi:hypothetical protein